MTDDEHETQPGFVKVRFEAREDLLEKLTTAAATQGMSINHVINVAMQHYEMALSAKPGQVLHWHDADDEVRRLYLVPGNLSRWDNVATFSMATMTFVGPLLLLNPWFLTVWLTAGLVLLICLGAMRISS